MSMWGSSLGLVIKAFSIGWPSGPSINQLTAPAQWREQLCSSVTAAKRHAGRQVQALLDKEWINKANERREKRRRKINFDSIIKQQSLYSLRLGDGDGDTPICFYCALQKQLFSRGGGGGHLAALPSLLADSRAVLTLLISRLRWGEFLFSAQQHALTFDIFVG